MEKLYRASLSWGTQASTMFGQTEAGAEGIASFYRKLFGHQAYYLKNHERVTAEIETHCAACGGSGIASRTPRKTNKCKACKGTGGVEHVTTVTVEREEWFS